MPKLMSKITPLLLISTGFLLLASSLVQARDNFVTLATSPYPPGCMSSNNLNVSTPSQGRVVYNDSLITLADFSGGSSATVNLQVYRRGCAEEERSVLFIALDHFTAGRNIAVPNAFVELEGVRYPMRLVREANTFESSESGRVIGLGSYIYLVDGLEERLVNDNTPILQPSQYDGQMRLILQDAVEPSTEYDLLLPPWNRQVVPLTYPLNGRLSGAWVSAGAEQQGFVIAFNEFVNADGVQQQVFFSWYTYDQIGSPLWLASSNFHEFNAASVELPLSLRTNGVFLGPNEPRATPAGTAMLTAFSCNALELEYDLTAIGLGSGTLTLTRSFALETAGYACRDLEARLAAP